MKGNRAINNDNPMRPIVDAQLAAYLASGGEVEVIPLGRGSGSLVVHLSAPENRKRIAKDMGKFFND